MRIQKEYANAKLNLYLDVVGVRSDGFHNIKSIMQAVSLYDIVTVKYIPERMGSIKLFIKGRHRLPSDSKNLAYRAASLYLERAALTAGIEITLEKNIPVAAGLGGGSADAAAVLRAMNKLFGRLFSERALIGLAAELGSDVPFCLACHTALCEGRGELLTKLSAPVPFCAVIAIADEHVSTPNAYRALDARFNFFDGSAPSEGTEKLTSLRAAMKCGAVATDSFYNIFEAVVLQECPRAAALKHRLVELGASVSLMSGSGPSVFGVFTDERAAQCAANRLSEEGFEAHVVKSVGK